MTKVKSLMITHAHVADMQVMKTKTNAQLTVGHVTFVRNRGLQKAKVSEAGRGEHRK